MAARRYSFVFYAAVIVALGATYAVYRVIESTKASSRIATAPVVVAAQDIPQGKTIDRLELVVNQWPASTVPPGAYARVDSVVSRVSRVEIFKGEPIVPGRLAPEGTAAGLEVLITPGKRAMSLRINDVTGISGLIQPNSRVDILLTMNSSGGESRRAAKLFMNNMRILAMQATTQRGDDGRPIPATVATLEVTPEETEKLAVAQAQGSLQLVLRGYGDPENVNTKGATTTDVANLLRDYTAPPVTRQRQSPAPKSAAVAPPPVVVPPPVVQPAPTRTAQKPDSVTVPVYRGTKRTDEKFKKDSVRRDTTTKN
jgi:pilus assembly protein CpaB